MTATGNVVTFPMPFLEPTISPEEQAFLDRLDAIERSPRLYESSLDTMRRAVRSVGQERCIRLARPTR